DSKSLRALDGLHGISGVPSAETTGTLSITKPPAVLHPPPMPPNPHICPLMKHSCPTMHGPLNFSAAEIARGGSQHKPQLSLYSCLPLRLARCKYRFTWKI
ncbi:MAG: hypothetical protein N3F10_05975, partial [Candidatus Bathyarchaeota archaeon]|nr:hypothetical protein [Candidatus Bathyarchaeota archaeon]